MFRWSGWAVLLLWGIAMSATLAGLAWRDWPDAHQRLFDTQCPIAAEDSQVWPIVLGAGRLYRIDIALVRNGPVAGRVVLRLTSDRAGAYEIARAEVPAAWAEDTSRTVRRPYGYVPFQFTPVECPQRDPVWLWLESDADTAVAARCLDRDRVPQLAFKAYHVKSLRENLAWFCARLLKNRHGAFGSVAFYAVLLPAYVALVVLLLWYMSCAPGWDGQDGQDRIE